MKKLFLIFLGFICLSLIPKDADAALYSVCASGCTSTTIQAIFTGNNLEPGDIIEVRADTEGGTKIYREGVTWGSDDQGSDGSPVILRGREGDTIVLHGDSDANGIDDISTLITINNISDVEVQNLTLTHPTTEGMNIRGNSNRVVVRDVTSTFSGNQAFQMEENASATYYNIVGNDNADDGFSMHGSTTAVIHTGSFDNNADGINFVDNATLTAHDITITDTSTEVIYPISVAEAGNITATFTNVTIDQTDGAFTDRVVYVRGPNVDVSIDNMTINNVPVGTATEIIKVDSGARLVLNDLVIDGNTADDANGVATQDATTELEIHGADIKEVKYGVVLTNGPAILSNVEIHNMTGYGIYVLSSASLTLSDSEIYSGTFGIFQQSNSSTTVARTYFHNLSDQFVDIQSSGGTLTIHNSIFSGMANLKFGVTCRASVTCNIFNNTFHDSNLDGKGFFVEGTSVVTNNIFTNLAAGIHKHASATLTASYNLMYGNTANFAGSGGSQTNAVTGNPVFLNSSGSYTEGSDYQLGSTSSAIDSGTALGSSYDDAIHPSSVWPSSVVTTDQDVRGAGWEIGAYIYPVPQAPTIGTPSVLGATSIRWNFTDNSNDETGFGVYDSNNVVVASATTTNLSHLDETGLTESTAYGGRYAKAFNSYGDSTPSAVAATTTTASVPPSDTTDPIISSIVSTAGDSEATITWTTDEAATSQVEYGTSTSYGTLTPVSDTDGTVLHSILLSSLDTCEIYHFRVRSEDLSGNISVSSDNTFSTSCSRRGRSGLSVLRSTKAQPSDITRIAKLQATVQLLKAQLEAMRQGTSELEATLPARSCDYHTNLAIGSTGELVSSLQQLLVAKGFLVMPDGVAYGYFGSLTQFAVMEWQKNRGIIPAVGYFGPISRAQARVEMDCLI